MMIDTWWLLRGCWPACDLGRRQGPARSRVGCAAGAASCLALAPHRRHESIHTHRKQKVELQSHAAGCGVRAGSWAGCGGLRAVDVVVEMDGTTSYREPQGGVWTAVSILLKVFSGVASALCCSMPCCRSSLPCLSALVVRMNHDCSLHAARLRSPIVILARQPLPTHHHVPPRCPISNLNQGKLVRYRTAHRYFQTHIYAQPRIPPCRAQFRESQTRPKHHMGQP